ncbi:MAG TPA: Stk1 family PASTA domain-containing Ser/Thr kinase [Ornithinicoccus sp.]|jgi:serine/threonine-protein kinase|nr:Stk1 family PASTA domain-containing Ser/Thr kinase [Ornithinicoccus sp.]
MTDEPKVLGGRYEVGELIGRGGMAEVHVGHDLRLGRSVAIKILRTDLARDTSFLARFRREAQAAAGLNHPSIVAVYDSGEQEMAEAGGAPVHVPYIVMEHVEGRTLRQVLNEEKVLDPDEAARITAAVLSALEYSHDRGIVHRDIKPANVMLTRGGAVKVMDFGIARAMADTAATMTQTQAVLGTARYLSPEQAQGHDVDTRSDLYSAGCLFYELLTGRTPFVGDPVSLVYQHLGEQPKAPSRYRPGIPVAMDAVALHALEKSPETRYQSAAAFREDLAAARAGRPVSAAAMASYDRAVAAGAAGDGTPAAAGAPTEAIPRAGAAAAAGVAASGARPPDRDEDERTDEIPVREERHRGGWLVVTVLALLALAAVAYVVWDNLGPGQQPEVRTVSVPDLRNRTEEQAVDALTRAGLVPDARTERSTEEVGRVFRQDPPPGREVEEGTTVTFWVSAGPETVEIPDLQGWEEDAARARLESLGLVVVDEVEEVNDCSVDRAGLVVRTDPEAETTVPAESEVTLVVASGRVDMEDLTGLDAPEAISRLRECRLSWALEYQATTEVDPNIVIGQSVEAGEEIEFGGRVVLTVSREPIPTVTATVTPPPPPPTTEPTEPPTDTGPTTEGPGDGDRGGAAPPTDTGPTGTP